MRLYLVRHGDALHGAIDPARPLSLAGRQTIALVSEFLNTKQTSVSEIWHSHKVRARETAEIIAEGLAVSVTPEEKGGLAPEDPVGSIVAAIESQTENLMIVGHLPFLPILALRLLNNKSERAAISFSQGKVLCLERANSGEWVRIFESPDY